MYVWISLILKIFYHVSFSQHKELWNDECLYIRIGSDSFRSSITDDNIFYLISSTFNLSSYICLHLYIYCLNMFLLFQSSHQSCLIKHMPYFICLSRLSHFVWLTNNKEGIYMDRNRVLLVLCQGYFESPLQTFLLMT